MTVFVQRESCGIMAHVFLEGLDIIAGLEAVYSEGVAKIVNPVASESGFLQNFLQFLPDGRLNVSIYKYRLYLHKDKTLLTDEKKSEKRQPADTSKNMIPQ